MSNANYGEDWPSGSIIEFCGENFRIRENYGNSGHVEHLDGTSASNSFYWIFDGSKCKLISLP